MKIYFSAMLTQLSLQAHKASHRVKLLGRKDSIWLTSEDSLDKSAIAITTRGNWMIPLQDWIGTRNDADLVIKTGSVEAMRIDAEGNVGIGTVEPQAKLHVAGDAKIGGEVNLDDFAFEPVEGSPPLLRLLGIDENGRLRGGDFVVVYAFDGPPPSLGPCINKGSHWATADGIGPDIYNCPLDGNVGIGLTNPTEKLTVAGNISLKPASGARSIIGNTGFLNASFSIFGNTSNTNGAFIQMNGSGASPNPNALILGTKQYVPVLFRTVNSSGTATNIMELSDGYVTITGNTMVSRNIYLNASSGERKIVGNVDDAGSSAFLIAANTNSTDGSFIEFYGQGSDDAGTVVFGSNNTDPGGNKGFRFLTYEGNNEWAEVMRITPAEGVFAREVVVNLDGWVE